MKKLFYLIIFMYILISVISCSGAAEKTNPTDPTNPVITKRIIHGIAATGAVIEEGASVQVRPAAIDGRPANIITSTVGKGGAYSVEIPDSVPKAFEKLSTPQNGNGFIIRIHSKSADSWIYSYSENDGADTTANVNPYTDKIIRIFYAQMNNTAYPFIYSYDQNIDNIFPSGLFSDNSTPVNIPEKATIDRVMTVMSNMLKDTYNLSDIQNALTDSWEIDTGLDGLLNLAGHHLSVWLSNEFSFLYQNPNALISSNIYEDDYSPTVNTVHVDIWTAYGNTGNVTVMSGWQFPWPDTLMVKQPDSVTGNNHYKATIVFNTPSGYQGDDIAIVIDDYQSGESVPIALKRP